MNVLFFLDLFHITLRGICWRWNILSQRFGWCERTRTFTNPWVNLIIYLNGIIMAEILNTLLKTFLGVWLMSRVLWWFGGGSWESFWFTSCIWRLALFCAVFGLLLIPCYEDLSGSPSKPPRRSEKQHQAQAAKHKHVATMHFTYTVPYCTHAHEDVLYLKKYH